MACASLSRAKSCKLGRMAQQQPKGGDGHPQFARQYPRTPDIDRLLRAFENGDYETVRLDAPKVAAAAKDPLEAAAARDLARRTLPDPMALYIMALTLALFVFLSAWVFLHKG
jgi:hypothetical protein